MKTSLKIKLSTRALFASLLCVLTFVQLNAAVVEIGGVNYSNEGNSTIVELKNVTGVKEWGLKYKLYHSDAGVVLEREYKVPFTGLCRAGKYTIISSFISEIRPKKPDSGVDAINITAKPYCKYDDKKKYFAEGGYINLYYPYMTKSGDPYTVGITTTQDFE